MDNIIQVPKGAWLTVNRACNFRCAWCYAEGTGYQKNKEMSLELAKQLADLIYEIGIRNLIVIGGEPTLWENLIMFNSYCKKLDIKTSLVTNAFLFGKEKFLKEYVKFPNDSISISLKAGNEKQSMEVCGIRNFNVVKKGIKQAIKQFNACVSITYNSFYIANLIELVALAVECGSKLVKIDFCSTTFQNGKSYDKYMVEPHQIVKHIVEDYEELNRITNGNLVFEMNLPFCLWPEDFLKMLIEKNQIMSVCHVLKREGIIFDTEGKLLMCNALFDYPLGQYEKDFDDPESLLNFINSKEIQSFYDNISSYPSLKCKNCEWYDKCGGGCPLKWAIYKVKDVI